MATNRVLFDTPVLIDLLERRPRAINRLRALADQGARLGISILTYAEIYAGIGEGEEERTKKLLDLFDVIPVSEALARKAAELTAARRNVGRAYTMDDMLIAATAMQYGAQLFTTNRKDFEVPGITFYTPER
jgi:predicted nucleic acid-binding protein